MSSWREVPVGARVFIVAWLLIQLGVPLSAVGSDQPPERFVWRMFSTAVPPPKYVVTTPDETVVIDLNDLTARLRADLPFDRFVPDHLCRRFPDASTVSWADNSYPCVTP